MKIPNNLISEIVAEAALDNRISDGIIDLKNTEHIQVIAEVLYDMCEDEHTVNEFVTTFIDEGKYPERQAFNREGWLVTFPSKEYRDAAIKKGTHAISDPTHGKGGMNLYYKRRGKQKRQTQQDTSMTQTGAQQAVGAAGATSQSAPEPTSSTGAAKAGQPDQPDSSKDGTEPADSTAYSKPGERSKTKKTQPDDAGGMGSGPSKDSSGDEMDTKPLSKAETPAIDVPVIKTPPVEYAAVSQKFASQKGWSSTPYDEYHDREGETVAVVGLSGEIVPVKTTDREEYKIFAEKQKAT
jgi:hypothetical protein